MKLRNLFLIIPFCFLSSCTKESLNNDLEQEKEANSLTNAKLGPIADKVYVVGRKGNDFSAQWFNGTQSLLSPSNGYTEAKSVFKANGNIYVAGVFDGKPCYWLNGVMNILPGTSSIYGYGEAKSIFVSGFDVYVAGYVKNIDINGQITEISAYWKNGVLTQLSDQSNANSIFVYGTDVYVCGYIFVDGQKAVVWKNNTMSYLNTSANYNCNANDIKVINGDVYVCGYGKKKYTNGTDPEEIHNKARYWKNGIETKLSDDNSRANYAYSIYIVNNDIYVAGSDIIHNANSGGINVERAKYWKNNSPIYLTDGISTRAEAYSIFVKNFTVYTVGRCNPRTDLSKSEAVIWNNTSMSNLSIFSTGYSTANSIFVE
ncbi:MAG: hypothetical protein QM535_03105 [Limnohabitans sp.]|nr:hypothetical protein [Limnohabitans sp.]